MLLTFGLASSAAAPGALDSTFGSGGKVSTDLGYQQAAAAALVIQSDGKLVAGGVSWNGANFDFALARYNPNGSLDTSFGSGGKVLTDFAAGSDAIGGLALQADGKIVATGRTTNSANTDTSFALARYNANGSLDGGFGSGGKTTVDFAATATAVAELSRSVLIQPDGKIVAAGFATMPGTGRDFAIARLNANGAPDSGFGTGGKATKDFFGGADSGSAVVLRSDGKLWMAGTAGAGGTKGDDVALARFTSAGVPDQTATVDLSATDLAAAAVLQSDGKLVVAGGRSNGADLDFLLMRFNATGTIDTSFGTQGATVNNWGGNDRPAAVALQADGKPVVVGWRWNGSNYDFAIARYTQSGGADTSFGAGGLVSVDFSGNDYGNAVAIQSDGKIVAAGQDPTDVELFGLVRILVSDEGGPPISQPPYDARPELVVETLEALDEALASAINEIAHGRLDGFEASREFGRLARMKEAVAAQFPPIFGRPAATVFVALDGADYWLDLAHNTLWWEGLTRQNAVELLDAAKLAEEALDAAFPPGADLPPSAAGHLAEAHAALQAFRRQLAAKRRGQAKGVTAGKLDDLLINAVDAKRALVGRFPNIFGVPAAEVFSAYEEIDSYLEDAGDVLDVSRPKALEYLGRALKLKQGLEDDFKKLLVPYTPPPPQYPLIDQNYAADGGVVKSEPTPDIDCPTKCSHDYPAGANVGLRAIPKPGYRFVRWVGGPCTGTPTVKTCTVVMDGPRVIRAEFEKIPGRCECASIGVQFKGYTDQHSPGHAVRVRFTLQWSLICSGGTGKSCSGTIKIHPPRGSDLKLTSPDGPVTCSGGCKKVFTRHVGGARIEFTSAHDLLASQREGKSFTFTFEKICAKKGKNQKVGKTTMTVAYDAHGHLDNRHSDFWGDRPRPDAPKPKH